MLELILAVAIVIVMSAVFSCTEAAILSLSPSKSKQLAEQSGTGKIVDNLRSNLHKPITAIVIGNNIANIVGTFAVSVLATKILSPTSMAWFPWIMTIAVIVFAEILPKNLGEKQAVRISCIMARPLKIMTFLMTPAVLLIGLINKLLFGNAKSVTTDEQEIRTLARIGQEENVIDVDEAEMVENVFCLDDTTAAQIMTPRVSISFVRGEDTLKESKEDIVDIEHSRIVVVGETVDEVLGYVMKSHMLQKIVKEEDLDAPLSELCMKIPIVKWHMPSDKLLIMFQRQRSHLAVVQDEFGGVAGVVSLEDVLEVITGEIVDETDSVADLAAEAKKNGNRLKLIQKLGKKDNGILLKTG